MNILINGGSRGIGRATALKAANAKGSRIIVTGRNKDNLRSLSEASPGRNIDVFELDTTARDERLVSLKNHILREKLKIDVLINFTGLLIKGAFSDVAEADVRRMMETNFIGPVLFIREMLPFMNNPAHIVNIGSMGGFQGSVRFSGLSWYSASKAALANITESLAVELSGEGISANCLCPGAVQTEMLEEAFPGYQAPLTPGEVAEFICEFAMNGHNYFNGKVLPLSRSTP